MLNKQQQKVVDSKSKNLLVLAGAGTGKTHVMLSRVSRLVKDGVNPHNILVLTFTNAAAFEMEDRYKSQHKRRIPPTFNTFHAFCYKLIVDNEKIRKLIGYTDVPTIPDEGQLKNIDIKVRQQLGTKLSNDKLQGKKTLSMKEQFDYDLYWKKFKQLLKIDNFITFDIMCYDVCILFAEDNPIIEEYKSRFKYIFVDEFQDTDSKQWDFVHSFNDANICVVGDIFQGIYAFRGGDSSIIKSLATDKNWETIRLIENYRSTIQICNFANQINIDAYDAYRLDLESIKEGDDVVVLDSPQTSFPNPKLFSLISEITSDTSNEIAIIVRTNAEVYAIKHILDSLEVVYNTNNDTTVQDCINILKSVLDDDYMVGWLSTKLNVSKYTEWVKLCSWDEDYKKFEKFHELYYNQMYIHNIINKVSIIRKILRTEDLLTYQKCMEIIKELGLPNIVINTTAIDPIDIVNYLIGIAENSKESNIYCGTIHSVKGLEYDIVHVLGVDGDSFSIRSEEMRNLYYVACTRAKSKLYVYRGGN